MQIAADYLRLCIVVCFALSFAGVSKAQQPPAPYPKAPTSPPPPLVLRTVPKPLGPGPWMFDTIAHRIRVVRVATLQRPWSIAFLPDGAMLITERSGRLRIMRNGVFDTQPIAGTPKVLNQPRDSVIS